MSKCQYIVPIDLIKMNADGLDGVKKSWFDKPEAYHAARDGWKIGGSTEIISIEGENDNPIRYSKENNGRFGRFESEEQVFEWWVSGISIDKFFSKKEQLRIDKGFDDEKRRSI